MDYRIKFASSRCDSAAHDDEVVVVIHGLAPKPMMMSLLMHRLRRGGYATVQWKYFSLYGSLARHARRLHADLEQMSSDGRKVHIVAHSMGSVVSRLALSYGLPPKMGRIVLIAPPNQGVRLARICSPLVRSFCPAIGELSDRSDSFVNQLTTPAGLEIGVIAGQFDTLVPLCSTRLASQTDHVSLPATHNSLLFQRRAAEQVFSFLADGRFRVVGNP
jgi:pimeloyl-ACP methyl ester carboxylesterase